MPPLSSAFASVNMPSTLPTHSSWNWVAARVTPPRMRCAAGVLVGPAEDRRGGTRAEGEGGELAHEAVAADVAAEQAFDRVDLDLVGVLAVDDDRVADLTGLDHVRREAHAVHEPEARVGDVEVDGGARQAQAVVQAHGDRRLEVLAGHRGVDEQADLGGLDSGLGQRAPSRRDRRVVGRLVGGPVAALEHAGDALQQPPGSLSRRSADARRSSMSSDVVTRLGRVLATDNSETLSKRVVAFPATGPPLNGPVRLCSSRALLYAVYMRDETECTEGYDSALCYSVLLTTGTQCYCLLVVSNTE